MKKFSCYKVYRHRSVQFVQRQTEKGAKAVAQRFAAKGERVTLVGVWYDESGYHEEILDW